MQLCFIGSKNIKHDYFDLTLTDCTDNTSVLKWREYFFISHIIFHIYVDSIFDNFGKEILAKSKTTDKRLKCNNNKKTWVIKREYNEKENLKMRK